MNNQSGTLRLATAAPSFAARMADAARLIARSMHTTEPGKQVLWDAARGRNLVTLQRLCDVSRTCTSVADSLALPDALRAYILERRPFDGGASLVGALHDEVEADSDEDKAVVAYLAHRTPANRARLIELLRQQEMTSRTLIDAICRDESRQPLTLVTA